MGKTDIVHQTKLAFDFIEKIYLEISYLIKELEGLLGEEEEGFIIGKPSGYSITSRSSQGLESTNVSLWSLKKMSVFFIAKGLTRLSGGVTATAFSNELKLIYLRIILDERDISEPYIVLGVFYDFIDMHKKWPTKFEQLMAHMEYHEGKVFSNRETVDFEDSNTKFKGKLFRVNLFDIGSSEDIVKLVVTPLLEIYRNI